MFDEGGDQYLNLESSNPIFADGVDFEVAESPVETNLISSLVDMAVAPLREFASNVREAAGLPPAGDPVTSVTSAPSDVSAPPAKVVPPREAAAIPAPVTDDEELDQPTEEDGVTAEEDEEPLTDHLTAADSVAPTPAPVPVPVAPVPVTKPAVPTLTPPPTPAPTPVPTPASSSASSSSNVKGSTSSSTSSASKPTTATTTASSTATATPAAAAPTPAVPTPAPVAAVPTPAPAPAAASPECMDSIYNPATKNWDWVPGANCEDDAWEDACRNTAGCVPMTEDEILKMNKAPITVAPPASGKPSAAAAASAASRGSASNAAAAAGAKASGKNPGGVGTEGVGETDESWALLPNPPDASKTATYNGSLPVIRARIDCRPSAAQRRKLQQQQQQLESYNNPCLIPLPASATAAAGGSSPASSPGVTPRAISMRTAAAGASRTNGANGVAATVAAVACTAAIAAVLGPLLML